MLGNLYGMKEVLSVVVRADVHLELHAGHPQHLRTFLTGASSEATAAAAQRNVETTGAVTQIISQMLNE